MNTCPKTLCEAFQRTVAVDPDGVALRTVGGTQTLTWRQYADRVRRVAAGLAANGVARADTVALMLANRPEFSIVDTAALHLGAIPFSMYNTNSVEQIAYLLENSGCNVIVCERQFAEKVRTAAESAQRIIIVDGRTPEQIFDGRLNERSHGESFLAFLAERDMERGLFILDEPEAALSFTSSLQLMAMLDGVVAAGSQVIMATHSPVLAAFPGATILEFGEDGVQQRDWEDLEMVGHWQRFLTDPHAYLRHLFAAE